MGAGIDRKGVCETVEGATVVMSDNLRLPGGGCSPDSPRCARTAVETLRREWTGGIRMSRTCVQ